ncbi:MAG TPA: SET domain-containing protein [Flavisolibacter sp.]|nr:SET domain-containing protein [Flavisolibacter sp.]
MKPGQVSYLLEGVYAASTRKRGRGVFTRYAIAAGTTIEIAPVIAMSAEDRLLLDKTLLHDYIFEWGENGSGCAMALGLIPMYNHSFKANCEYEMYFTKQAMTIKTVRNIKAGEELFINYNGEWNSEKEVWFPLS